jgi:hypothetical protein
MGSWSAGNVRSWTAWNERHFQSIGMAWDEGSFLQARSNKPSRGSIIKLEFINKRSRG